MGVLLDRLHAFKNVFSGEKSTASCTHLGSCVEEIEPNGIAASYIGPWTKSRDYYLYQAEPGKVIDGKALSDALYGCGALGNRIPVDGGPWNGVVQPADEACGLVGKECDGARAVLVTRTEHDRLCFKPVTEDEMNQLLNGDSNIVKSLSAPGKSIDGHLVSGANLDSCFVEKDEPSMKRDISLVGENNSVKSSKQDDFGIDV